VVVVGVDQGDHSYRAALARGLLRDRSL